MPSEFMPWCVVGELFPLIIYYSRTVQQNVTKFGVKHHWGKGNQLYVNEGAGPPGDRGVGSNRGNKGIYLKTTPQERLHRM